MTRTEWRDGDRSRSVEVEPLGGDRYRVTVDGAAFEAEAARLADGRLRIATPQGRFMAEITASGSHRVVRLGALEFSLDLEGQGSSDGRARRSSGAAGGGLESPMPGVVTRVLVAPGDAVESGQALLALEAMKMEHLIRAPRRGVVRAIHARTGEMVAGGTTLVELEPDEPSAA
jgi:3-methylcrotonyl-CoA carboxylase alpha subunit